MNSTNELKFSSQICTTREQSQRLLKLGLKRDTADMYMTNMSIKGLDYIDDWQIGSISYCDAMHFWKEIGLKLEHGIWEIVPTWSLGRLLELCGGIAYDWLFRSDNYFENMVSCIEWMVSKECINKDYLGE